jgi:hypothetical protein
MDFQVKVFWIVTLCTVKVGYKSSGGTCRLHLQVEVNGTGKEGIDKGME